MCRLGTSCTSRSTRVVLPVPDGAETMNSRPRRAAAPLLDILNLLPHLLEFGLGVDDQLRNAEAVGLGADGVDLAVHFLEQEIELPAARLGTVGQRRPVREVAAEPGDFFGDVGTGRRPHDL